MGKDALPKINNHAVKGQALATVERGSIGKSQRELLAQDCPA
jgi:hypothetical protein